MNPASIHLQGALRDEQNKEQMNVKSEAAGAAMRIGVTFL